MRTLTTHWKLLLIPVLLALIALAGTVAAVQIGLGRDRSPVWVTETYTLDEASDIPRWVKTVEKTVLDEGAEGGHTTKIILPGSKVAYITFENVGVKPGSGVILKVNGNGNNAGTYLVVDKLVLDKFNSINSTFSDSEYGKVTLKNIEADGASLHHTVQQVPSYPPINGQEWNSLPGLAIKDVRTDEIVVEVRSADARVGTLTFENVRVPGQTEFTRVKGNELIIKDSSFGDGDGNATTHALVIKDTVKQGTFSQKNVRGDAKVDNR